MSDTEWLQNAVVYHILVDRFAGYENPDGSQPQFCGGNIRAIREKLPYLKDLGVNTIWLSPFYKTSAYHGYHVTDFYKPDPRFGSLKDLKALINEGHRRGFRFIADFVANHCSSQHPIFLDAQKNTGSIYRKWFYFTRWPDEYLCFLSVKELPKINLDHPPAREHITQAALHWLDQGFDGFRLDHCVGPSHDFWRAFRGVIKKRRPDAVLIGEAWFSGVERRHLPTLGLRRKNLKWLLSHLPGYNLTDAAMREYVGELDGCLDFVFQNLVREYIAQPEWYRPEWLLRWMLWRHYSRFPPGFHLPTFLDNHDMDRFLYQCRQNKHKLMEAARIQFKQRHPPVIYYGTEVGVTQENSVLHHGDLLARKPMPWDTTKWDSQLISFYRNLIKKRVEGMRQPTT